MIQVVELLSVDMKVAAEQVCHLPLRPNTLEKTLPVFRWLPKLLATAFCNILSLLATCIMTFILPYKLYCSGTGHLNQPLSHI